MVRRHGFVAFVGAVVAVGSVALAGCGANASTGASSTAGTSASTTASPTSQASATSAPTTTESTSSTSAVPATGSAVEIKIVSTPYGMALGGPDGRVLYAWDKEADGSVVCVDAACVEKWPPLLASTVTAVSGVDSAQFSVIVRPDGTTQAALHGKPLYNMMADAPGEANCQGGDGWWIVHPDGSKNTSETPEK